MKLLSGKNRKLVIILLVLMHISFLFVIPYGRNLIFRYYLHKKIVLFNNKHNINLSIEKSKIKRISIIELQNIRLKKNNGTFVMSIDNLKAKINILKLLTGRIDLSELELNNIQADINKQEKVNEKYSQKDKKNNKHESYSIIEVNISKKIKTILSKLFEIIPSKLNLSNLNAKIKIDKYKSSIFIDEIITKDNRFDSLIKIKEFDDVSTWSIDGSINKSQKEFDIKIYSKDKKTNIPFIKWKYQADVNFDKLEFKLKKSGNIDGENQGFISTDNLIINHENISKSKVTFDHLHIDYIINVENNFLELSKGSKLIINKLNFEPYIKFIFHPKKQIRVQLNAEKFLAQNLFASLPEGMFNVLQEMKTRGELSYDLKLSINFDNPDSLLLDSKMHKYDFGILSYGSTPLTIINKPFVYTVFEKGAPVKSFDVDEINPQYRKLEDISNYLKSAVLASEDPEFYHHNGFMKDAIRESLITDIKKKRFARGGSTITMQLVKNVFLNKNKTIGRKLEEILIAWLIENNNLISKDRIFEVYLNIIEWGPGIYGANEAARFYFNKDVRYLTLSEAIFLARIIPKPNKFTYFFDASGNLKDITKKYYNSISKKLLASGAISQFELDSLAPSVKIRGIAKKYLKIVETTPFEEYEELNDIFQDIDF